MAQGLDNNNGVSLSLSNNVDDGNNVWVVIVPTPVQGWDNNSTSSSNNSGNNNRIWVVIVFILAQD